MTAIPTTNKPHIILVQGLPYSGKDAFYKALTTKFKADELVRLSFGDIIKDKTHKALGLDVDAHHFASSKDVIDNTYFNGFTPREAYIEFSENFLKKYRGKSIVGLELTEQLKQLTRKIHPPKLIVITDSGFLEEGMVVLEYMGYSSCSIVQVERDDSPDVKDSRYLFEVPDVSTYTIKNNGSLEEYYQEVISLVENILA